MDHHEYRQITNSVNVFSRGVLEETICVIRTVNPLIANKLQAIISVGPIEKPEKHQGGSETDYFQVQLDQSELEVIVEAFCELEFSNLSSKGETTLTASHYATVLDIWHAAT